MTNRFRVLSAEDVAAAGGLTAESSVPNIEALRALGRHIPYALVRGFERDGDGGGGLFYMKHEKAAEAERPGLYVIGSDGAGWTRQWDGENFNAAWVGIRPDGSDCGSKFSRLPKRTTVNFSPGEYVFASYPPPADFSDRFYRGKGVVWKCTGALTESQRAFVWSYANGQDFGVDNGGQNVRDMTLAGLSPIEGIGIIGPGTSTGICFSFDNTATTRPYFVRPKNFSIGNFRIGFGGAVTPMRNFFLTGADDCVFKGNHINIRLDNTGSVNSGENITFRRCYIGNASGTGIEAIKLQLLVLDNCSLDYNARHAVLIDTNTKMTACYLETNNATTKADMIKTSGVAKLVIDETSNIYALGWADRDIFSLDGISTIVCNATVDMTGPWGARTLYTGERSSVFGRTKGCNGDNWANLLSRHQGRFADPEFSIQGASGALNLCPDSSPPSRTMLTRDGVRENRRYAVRMTAPSPEAGAVLGFHRMPVSGGEWMFISHYDKVVGTIVNLAHRLQFFTAEGLKIGEDVFIGGSALPPGFSNFGGSFSREWNVTERGWTSQRAVAAVPPGADYVLAQLRIDPNSTGLYFVSDYYLWQ